MKLLPSMPLNILLIDDALAEAQAIAGTLARVRPDWRVTQAADLSTARLGLQSETFDLVLVRQPLPDGAALDLLPQLAGRPALIMIEPGGEAQAAEAMRHGFVDYLIRGAQRGYLHVLPEQIEAALRRAGLDVELRESMARAELALDGAELVLWERNLATNQLKQSTRWRDILGYPPDYAPTAEEWREAVHPEDWKVLQHTLKEYFEGRTQRYECEYRMRHRAGHWVWMLSRGRLMERDAEGRPLRIAGTLMDVTARKQVEQALANQRAQLDALIRALPDHIWMKNPDGIYQVVNPAIERHFGVPSGWMIGRTDADLLGDLADEATLRHFRETDLHVLRTGESLHFQEWQTPASRGEPRLLEITKMVVRDAQGQAIGVLGVARDITERHQAETEIRQLAFYDELTGLPNRRLLRDRLAHALATSRRTQEHGALLFLDLDNFKDLNDTLGHDQGDRLLEQVAQRLAACVRASDTVARLGGDEFVVVLEELDANRTEAAAQAESVAQKILDALNEPYTLAGAQHHSTPSLGITLFDARDEKVDELLKQADLAMYQAKAAGRNTLCFFDPEMQTAVSARAALEADLRLALQRTEFVLHYQPVVDAARRVVGVEALVRWPHPQRGLIAPAEFVPLAERTGLILPLGRQILQIACEQLATWGREPAMAHLTMAVNVSAREFRQPDFAAQVLAVLRSTGADPRRLMLELTESLLLHDTEDSIAKMEQLREHGVGFSLDDFGTGYSSLAYLKRLPLDQLKIDQSFVRDLLSDPNDAVIARTVITLARSLGLAVVAEGVEIEGQLDFLLRHGCEHFQGYLLGKPAPMAQLRLGD